MPLVRRPPPPSVLPATVTVDPSRALGPVKPMNAVNNGPAIARADQSRGNFADFRALRVPFARTHDSINQATSNGHTVDISAVFPDFGADENDPASYDFAYTDAFLEAIIAAGAKPFFRLGQTIENVIKKYHVFPPAEPASRENGTVVTAVAAKGADGSLGVLLARYCDDRNVTSSETFALRLAAGRFAGRVRGYLTDAGRLHSPVHLVPSDDGTVRFELAPNAFLYIETRLGL